MTLRDVDTTSEYDLGEGYQLPSIDVTVTLDVSVDLNSQDRPHYEWTVVRFTVQGDRWDGNQWEKKNFEVTSTSHPALFTVLRVSLSEDHIREQLHQQDQDHF